jgi:hypothetical protein
VKKAIEKVKIPNVKIVFITVNTNVTTVIYAQGEFEGQYKNPVSGTVVDSSIVKPNSFYLVSTYAK